MADSRTGRGEVDSILLEGMLRCCWASGLSCLGRPRGQQLRKKRWWKDWLKRQRYERMCLMGLSYYTGYDSFWIYQGMSGRTFEGEEANASDLDELTGH